MLRTWFLTVFSEMNSSLAMSRLFMPRATSRSTSISRSVRRGAGTCRGGSSSSRRARAANSVSSLAAVHGADRACYLIERDVFQQVAACPGADRVEEVLFLVADRQHDDLCAGGDILERPARLDTAAPRHTDVHEHHVGQRLARHPHCLFAIARLADELDSRDRKSTRLNSSHVEISYAVFCLKKKKKKDTIFLLHKKNKKNKKKT